MKPSIRITSAEARSIARAAYTSGFPLVENYKSLYKQAIDTNGSDFKAPINQMGHDPLPPCQWDSQSLDDLRSQYEKEAAQSSRYKGMQGPRGTVDEKTRHLAAASAWGLFPEQDATYLNYNGGHDYRVCHKATYQIPENNAFWSITVYGNDGFMKSENSIINSSNVRLNDDGTFTVYFGSQESCGDVPNRLDVSEGWNFLMRIDRPGASV